MDVPLNNSKLICLFCKTQELSIEMMTIDDSVLSRIHSRNTPDCCMEMLCQKYLNYLIPIWELFLALTKLKLRIIAKKTLRDFRILHPDSDQQLKVWYQETSKAQWEGAQTD
ncbi:MAG: hypothetical protein ABI863_09380 [Ginsengibacter sp.]